MALEQHHDADPRTGPIIPLRTVSGGDAVILDGHMHLVVGHGPDCFTTLYREGRLIVSGQSAEVRRAAPSTSADQLCVDAVTTLYRLYCQARDELGQERDNNRATLDRIRSYAVEQYWQQIPICRSGLVEFLDEFDMTPLRQRVQYTISGSFDIDHNPDEPVDPDRITPDLSDIDGLVTESDTHEVTIDQVSEVEE